MKCNDVFPIQILIRAERLRLADLKKEESVKKGDETFS